MCFCRLEPGPTQFVCIAVIFVLTGVKLKTDEVRKAFAAWRCSIWGSITILFITPLLGTALQSKCGRTAHARSRVVGGVLAALVCTRLPLEPTEFRTGLALFCCMPTVRAI